MSPRFMHVVRCRRISFQDWIPSPCVYTHTTSCLPIHPSVDIEAAPSFCLLRIMLLWTRVYTYLFHTLYFKSVFSPLNWLFLSRSHHVVICHPRLDLTMTPRRPLVQMRSCWWAIWLQGEVTNRAIPQKLMHLFLLFWFPLQDKCLSFNFPARISLPLSPASLCHLLLTLNSS